MLEVKLSGTWKGERTARGIAVGRELAACRDDIRWSVTHVRSGLALTTTCCCVFMAIEIAESVESLVDWSLPIEQIKRCERSEEIKRIIRETKCPEHGEERRSA